MTCSRTRISIKLWIKSPYMGTALYHILCSQSSWILSLWCCLHNQSFRIPNRFKGAHMTLPLCELAIHIQSHFPDSVLESQVFRAMALNAVKCQWEQFLNKTHKKWKYMWGILVIISYQASFIKTNIPKAGTAHSVAKGYGMWLLSLLHYICTISKCIISYWFLPRIS